MNAGLQTLDAVLEVARARPDHLEAEFDVPVLVMVGEQGGGEGPTTVTGPPGGQRMAGEPETFVLPLTSSHPKLATARLSFGRSIVCDIVIPFSFVSKHHGNFEVIGGVWLVTDMGSTNGTLVDERPVTKTGSPLTDGCSIQVGKLSARFFTARGFCGVLRERLASDPGLPPR